MTSHTTVSVNDDLASGEASVAHRTTNYEAPCGVDVVLGIGVKKMLRNRLLNHLLEHFPTQTTIVYQF